ncbi:glycosyltransferase family 39 protein [Streptomyces sp. DT190]|uniref:glycosyltransferase family 39 protein n=1 Tax=unclassified Streptomyces TaxID=2593676 RepID=UPI003CF4D539
MESAPSPGHPSREASTDIDTTRLSRPAAARSRTLPAPPAPRKPGTAPSPPAAPGPAHRLGLLLPPLLALATGLWGIRRDGALWQDEAVTYEMAHRPLPGLWATLAGADAVHGLYYLLMHGVFTLWEGGPATLRLPSVLATAGAAAGVAALGRRLAGPRAGLAAGVLFPLLPAVQRYAQEGRSYALVTALVVAQTWLLLRACTERGGRRRTWWAGYALLSALAGLLHEFALLALPAHGIALLASRAPRAVRRAWARAACGAAVTVTPLVLLSLRQSGQVAWIHVSLTGDVAGFLLPAAVGVAAAAVVRRGSAGPAPGPRPHTWALPLLLVPPALLLLASAVRPLYVDRYVLWSQAGLALLVGAALDRLSRQARARGLLAPVLAAAAVAALWPVGTHLRDPGSRTDDTLAIGRAVAQVARPGDAVLFVPASRRVWTLSREPASYGAVDLALAVSPRAGHTLYGTELPAPGIRSRMLRVSRIVVVHDPARDRREADERERTKKATLRAHFTPCGGRTVGVARIVVHERGSRC